MITKELNGRLVEYVPLSDNVVAIAVTVAPDATVDTTARLISSIVPNTGTSTA